MRKSDIKFSTPVTGSAPPPVVLDKRAASEKNLVEEWFVRPLRNMSGEDVFVCLMLCFPIIEAVIRYELNIPDEHEVKFSDNSKALNWFAKFMQIPEAQARSIWNGFRNGLLHRSMVKIDANYELSSAKSGRVAEYQDNKIYLYVWEFRDAVVKLLEKHHKNLWKGSSTPLPRVYIHVLAGKSG